jgi:Protein of unknown function (DUF3563)
MHTVQGTIPLANLAHHSAVHHILPRGQNREGRKEIQMNVRFLSRMFPRVATQRELEMAYLNQSTSMIDLEYREREIDRGRFQRRNY